MSSKKVKEAVTELLEKMKAASTAAEVEELAHTALCCVSFAEMDEKKSRISLTEGNKLVGEIEAAKALRVSQLTTA